MDKTIKIILIVVGSVIVLCACATVTVFATGLWTYRTVTKIADQTVSESPQEVVRVGGEIADYEVPEGFGSPVSLHIGDMTMIRYRTQDEMSYILLAQFPERTSIDVEKMLELMEEGSGDPANVWYSADTKIIEQKPIVICGQETTLNVSEGINIDRRDYRYATAKFEGRGGPALVMVATPVDEWDMEMVEDFILTIR
ncbi:MAG: hypothetical protein PVJ21_08200 [Anaerolineales bacterium]